MVRATPVDKTDLDSAHCHDDSSVKRVEASRRRTDPNATLLHDLRNTLAGLKLEMTLLEDDLPLRGEVRTRILAISGELQQAIEISGRLYGRLGQPGPLHEPVDSNDVLRGIVEMVQRTLPFCCAVEIDLETRIWPALVDPGLLHRALVDLVTRAEASMPGGGLLYLTSSNVNLSVARANAISDRMPAGRYVRLTVAGSGRGTPAAGSGDIVPLDLPGPSGEDRPTGPSSLDEAVGHMGGQVRVHHGSMMTTYELYLPAVARDEDPAATCRDDATDPRLRRHGL